MTCARYRALISRHLDNELTSRQRAELLAHVEHCASCAADLAHYRQDELLLRKLPEGQPNPRLKAAVLRETRRASRRRRRGLIWLLSAGGRTSPRLGLALIAILLVLPVAAGVVLSSAARRAIGAPFGFSTPAPSPTQLVLEVPASPTAAPPGPLPPPHVVVTSPYDGAVAVDPHTSVLLSFDQPMDRRSVEHAFRVSPPVPGDFQWEADNQVRFHPQGPGLLQGVTYTVALTDGARSLAGGLLAPATSWSFQTLPGPRLQGVVPADGAVDVPATATLVLTFSRPISTATVDPLIRLVPANSAAGWTLHGSGHWAAGGQVLQFVPDAPLPAGAIRVSLDAGARDLSGDPVPPTTWTFTVAPPGDTVTLDGPPLRILPLGETLSTIRYNRPADPGDVQSSAVRFALYPLSAAQLAAHLPWLVGPGAGPGSPWPPISTAGQVPLRSWAGLNHRAGSPQAPAGILTTTLPVREPGLYLLTAQTGGGPGDQRILALSDAGLLLWRADRRWWAWVSSLSTGLAVPGAQVHLYDATGKLLVSGPADDQGLFSAALPPEQVPALALADVNGGVAVALADPAGLQAAILRGDNDLGATVILDRDRYHPGETVLFTALIRPPTVALAGVATGVQLHDGAGRDLAVLSLQADPHGLINGAFPLAPDLAAGPYSLAFTLGDYRYVEPFVVDGPAAGAGPSALRLQVNTAASMAYAGDLITATVAAGYGPARPAAGLTVTLRLRPRDPAAGPTAGQVLTATAGDDGLAHMPIRVPAWDAADASGPVRTYELVAQAHDAQDRSASALALLQVRAGRLAVVQSLPQHAFAPGATTVLTVTVRDEAGQPAPGAVVSSGLYTPGAPAAGAGVAGSLLGSQTRVTNADGVATATLSLPLQGAFTVRSIVTDSMGVRVGAATPIWAFAGGSSVSWAIAMLPRGGISLAADQDMYRPGETMHLLVQAVDAGGGLVVATLQGRIVAVQAIRFAAGGGVFALPVPANPDGAETLRVYFVRFGAGSGDAQVQIQALDVPLRPALDLALTVPAGSAANLYLPGQDLPLHVGLRADGAAPGGGEVLLRLAPVAGLPPAESAPPVAATSWPLPGAPPDPAALPAPPPASWRPDLALDGSGELSTTVRLPDSPGLWMLDAWAFTAGGVTHTRQTVRTGAPAGLDWTVPAHLVQGDTATITAALTNRQPGVATLDARLQLQANGVLELAGPAQSSLRLAPGETGTLVWNVRAVGPGSGQVVLDVGGAPGFPMARQQTIAVAPYGVSAAESHAGTVADAETINMTLSSDVDPSSATLEVHAAATLPGVLADAVGAQTLPAGAARGPVDDAAARLVAAAALQHLYSDEQVDTANLPADLARSNQLDLQYLYGSQRADGAWGAWPGSAADALVTAHALQAFWELAHDGGQPADAATVARGLAWLRGAASTPRAPGADPSLAPPAAGAVQVAPVLYVLSLFNALPPGSLDGLLAVEPQIGPRERAFLALALAHAGRGPEAHLVVARLGESADGAADPVVLDALVGADPAGFQDVATPRADALLAARAGATWDTPATTAAAVLALSHYAARVPDTSVAGTYRVIVNGEVLRDVVVGPNRTGGGSVAFTVPANRLHTGDNPVRLEASGLHLYYSLRVQALLNSATRPIPSQHAAGAALGLLRVYEPQPDGTTTVVLTLTVAAPLAGARLDDTLPAGLTRLAPPVLVRLGTAGDGSGTTDLHTAILASAADPTGIQVALAPLAPGTYVFTYPAATVAPGSYTALPAQVQVPGDPSSWVRSGSATLTIDQ